MPPKKPLKKARQSQPRRARRATPRTTPVRSTRPRRGQRRGAASTMSRMQPVNTFTAPVAVGSVGNFAVPPSFSGEPQWSTDVTSSPRRGPQQTQTAIRVVGMDVIQGTYGLTFTAEGGPNFYGLCAELGVIDTGATTNSPLTPANISSRLAQIEEIYYYYAIRSLVLNFIPSVNPTTTIANNADPPVNLPLGSLPLGFSVAMQADAAGALAEGAPFFTNVLQSQPAVSFTSWEPATLSYEFTGKKVWKTSKTNEADSEQYTQALLLGASAISYGSGTDSSTYQPIGIVRCTYVIDFYLPSPILNSPALTLVTGAERIIKAFQMFSKIGDSKELTLSGYNSGHVSSHMERLIESYRAVLAQVAPILIAAQARAQRETSSVTSSSHYRYKSSADRKTAVEPPESPNPSDPTEFVQLIIPEHVSPSKADKPATKTSSSSRK